ncbi:MAG: hypothetical protein MRT15_12550 [archaeon YNP-LCB-003-016]|uniref:hypothetical protein n=1 Tax=Candidatus Culexarchaeum yellowstonense TaxID=2928963 RepID=UPI0026ECCDF4|nr:hypothetical protein [Candidatus Culexarchaeum yellowstonense]MCR6693218.1 hypothetical protein [Candidatus Culexarchaeum yellowstonense]
MNTWLQANIPRAGEEWIPLREKFEGGIIESVSVLEEFENNVLHRVEPYLRDRDILRLEKREHVIKDPLAYYVPYHFSEMGIYFRINKMISDFRAFVSKYPWPNNITVNELWYVYVMTIFWHEMAHHVIEDVATLMEWMGKARYPLMPHLVEEMFCEFNAFTTAEKQLSPPNRYNIPILPYANLPSGISKGETAFLNRRLILSCLYYHWGRNNPTSTYRPIVRIEASQAVDGLWNGLWNAHKGGYEVVKAPYEIYKRLYCTTL